MSEIEVRFIRHATGSHMANPELIAGRSMDAVLTNVGIDEAERRGRQLAGEAVSPDVVVSSPAERCLQTSRIILSTLGLRYEPLIANDLTEMDQGDYVGRVRAEIYNAEVQKQIQDQGKDFALPGGESMNQVGCRGVKWLRGQESLLVDKRITVLAVAHAGLITHTVGTLENWDQPTSLKMLKSMPPVAESVVVFNGEEWRVQSFAEPVQE